MVNIMDFVNSDEEVRLKGRKSLPGAIFSGMFAIALTILILRTLMKGEIGFLDTLRIIMAKPMNLLGYMTGLILVLLAYYNAADAFISNIIITQHRIIIQKVNRIHQFPLEELSEIVPIKQFGKVNYIGIGKTNGKIIYLNNLKNASFKEILEVFEEIKERKEKAI